MFAQTSLEEILFENSEDTDVEVLENLQYLQDNPSNINNATPEQLARFPLLTDVQIQHMIVLRDQVPFTDWTDFQNRTKFDSEITRWLSHYFMLEPPERRINLPVQVNWRERFQRKFPESNAYQSQKYPGSIWKNYQRAHFQIGNLIKGGLFFEKDPGEVMWNDHQVGFLLWQMFGNRVKMLVGNYRIQTGQGLALWGPYGTGKSASPSAAFPKSGETIHGYLNADENRFFTGGTIQLNLRNWTVLSFWSDTPKDANLDSTIQSFDVSGFHRTQTEIGKNETVQERMIGGRVAFHASGIRLGCTGWQGKYSAPVASQDPIRQTFEFHGQSNHVIGCDWNTHFNTFRFAGEIARSKSGGHAVMMHLFWQIRSLQWTALYRDFSPDFQNPNAQGFGYGDAANERGFFIGGQMRINRQTRINFYMDACRTPWRTYLLPMPTIKSDFLMQAEHRFSSTCLLSVRVRRRSENKTADGKTVFGRTIHTLQDQHKQQFRVDLHIKPKSSIQLRSRLEFVNINRPEIKGEISMARHQETGFLCFQDIRYTIRKIWTCYARWACFETDSYTSRIYMFENDVPGVLTNSPFYNRGTRAYTLIKWRPKNWIAFTIKYGITYHDGETSWGTGLDEMIGDTVKDFGVQMDVKF